MRIQKVCILGGTGFVGRHLVSELTRAGYPTRVLTRRRERHRDLLVFPTLELVETNVHYVSDLATAFADCDAVINLVGILNTHGGTNEDFETVHGSLPAKVVEACQFNRIRRLLHMSALGASPEGPSRYLRTKAEGERAVHAVDPAELGVTTFRPSVIFGPDDDFFNRFAKLLARVPVFPLACANARFAPVYVQDVVRALAGSLEDKTTFGKRYELCGPEDFSLAELVAYTARVAELRRLIWPLGPSLSRLQARLLEFAPGKPFTRDNFLSMQVDSTCAENGLRALGVEPTGIASVVPSYLGHDTRSELYARLRTTAGRD